VPGVLVNLGHEPQWVVSRVEAQIVEVVRESGVGWFSRESVHCLRQGGLSL